jgi:hypothetical protein
MKAHDRENLMPLVLNVLKEARSNKKHHFLSAYQILERLEESKRKKLIDEFGAGGRGAGLETAAGMISQVLTNEIHDRDEVAYVYLDARDVKFHLDGGDVEPGNRVTVTLYKYKTDSEECPSCGRLAPPT